MYLIYLSILLILNTEGSERLIWYQYVHNLELRGTAEWKLCVKFDLFCELLFMGCIDCFFFSFWIYNKPCLPRLQLLYVYWIQAITSTRSVTWICVHAGTSHGHQERKDTEHEPVSSGWTEFTLAEQWHSSRLSQFWSIHKQNIWYLGGNTQQQVQTQSRLTCIFSFFSQGNVKFLFLM